MSQVYNTLSLAVLTFLSRFVWKYNEWRVALQMQSFKIVTFSQRSVGLLTDSQLPADNQALKSATWLQNPKKRYRKCIKQVSAVNNLLIA